MCKLVLYQLSQLLAGIGVLLGEMDDHQVNQGHLFLYQHNQKGHLS